MQYWQRKLQRSVTETRRSSICRPWPSRSAVRDALDEDTRAVTELSRQYAKLCDVRDFEDPALLSAILSTVPERDPLAHVSARSGSSP